MGMTENAVNQAFHRFRQRYQALYSRRTFGSFLSGSRQWNGHWHIWCNREKDDGRSDTDANFVTETYSHTQTSPESAASPYATDGFSQ